MKGIRYKNKVSGVEGYLIDTRSKRSLNDVWIIKTDDGREYFGPSYEFEVV